MNLKPQKILVVDRPLNLKERDVDLFDKCYVKGYEIIITPSETPGVVQFVFFNFTLKPIFEDLFSKDLSFMDEEHYFHTFEVQDFQEQEFLDNLEQTFEASLFRLTSIEKTLVNPAP